jgi:ATP phosphoribosyltransferase
MLTLGLPSKGRLKEATEKYFQDIGLPIVNSGGERDYTGKIQGLDNIQVFFLQASEITHRLGDGTLDLGVTGYDLLAEKEILDKTYILKKLNFGYADLVFTVPESWIDVQSISDLDDIMFFFRRNHNMRFRIATKYINLTTQFLRQHKITNYRIIESQGATEGAPAAGVAEAVVDITSTGATLRDNHLKIIPQGLILKSQAVLTASLVKLIAKENLDTIRRILDFIHAHDTAIEYKMIQGAFSPYMKDDVLNCMINYKSQDIHVTDSGFSALVHKNKIYQFCEALRATGAHLITVNECKHIFQATNLVYDEFINKMNQKLC